MIFTQDITRWVKTQHVTDSTRVANGTRYDEPTDFRVQVTPMSQKAVVERLGYDLDQPYLVFARLSDAESFATGHLVSYDDKLHTIVSPVEKFAIGNAAKHCSFVMERQQYQFSEPD